MQGCRVVRAVARQGLGAKRHGRRALCAALSGAALSGAAVFATVGTAATLLIGCQQDDEPPASRADPEPIRPEQGGVAIDAALLVIFKPMPSLVDSLSNPVSDEKRELGRMLYFDERLSASGQASCNGCHPVASFGTDGRKLAEGHGWETPTRNAPSVYNAAGHIAQFWDGRARNVEEAIARHVIGSAPYALPSGQALASRLNRIPGYRRGFARAFPGEPVGVETYAKAIAAYVRGLMTPAPWDDYLKWNQNALTDEQQLGFLKFVRLGCQSCHIGTYLGGNSFQKLGVERPWPAPQAGMQADEGRFEVTEQEEDRGLFKVPSLRNVTKTAPYFHDGSVDDLDQAVKLMALHQLGKEVSDEDARLVVSFLGALTGEPIEAQTRRPELPPSGEAAPEQP